MRLLAFAASTAMLIVTAASADPIEDRKNIMKERGAQMDTSKNLPIPAVS